MSIINLIVTETEDNEKMGYVEIITHKGTTRAGKALVVMDNEHNGNYTLGILNLDKTDKEVLFDILDKTLHAEKGTREYMQERIEYLEGCTSEEAFDYESDFSQNKM